MPNNDLALLDVALLYLDDCKLECDGMTYAISHLLSEAGISHRMMIGAVHDPLSGDSISPHCWIELRDHKAVIDYRLRYWLGDDDLIPHGVFCPDETGMVYQGDTLQRPPLTKPVLMMMTDDRLAKVSLIGFA